MIYLWQDTRVRFNRLALEPVESGRRPAEQVEIDLSAGRMLAVMPKLPAGSGYEIKLPLGVVRILTNGCEISSEGVIKVHDGSVSVTYPGSPEPQRVVSNQQFDVRTRVLQPIPHLDY